MSIKLYLQQQAEGQVWPPGGTSPSLLQCSLCHNVSGHPRLLFTCTPLPAAPAWAWLPRCVVSTQAWLLTAPAGEAGLPGTPRTLKPPFGTAAAPVTPGPSLHRQAMQPGSLPSEPCPAHCCMSKTTAARPQTRRAVDSVSAELLLSAWGDQVSTGTEGSCQKFILVLTLAAQLLPVLPQSGPCPSLLLPSERGLWARPCGGGCWGACLAKALPPLAVCSYQHPARCVHGWSRGPQILRTSQQPRRVCGGQAG